MNKPNILDLFNLDSLEVDKFKELKDIKDAKNFDTVSKESIKDNIVNFSSEKLCQLVIAHRYLKYDEELSILAMEELGKRRVSGENFDFESYIENCLSQLPPLKFNLLDLRSIISLLK